jgi:SAM-dependent methyltransferase
MGNHLDRFSNVAKNYAAYRPVYPEDLYRFIFSQVSRHNRAWDAGTGNGQVARRLAKRFSEVIATDISPEQISQAPRADNIDYRERAAEDTDIESGTVDLTTTAQAIHWFDIPAFAGEVERVSASGAILAVWGYTLVKLRPDIDRLVMHLYENILDGFWDPQREIVNRRYRDLSLGFTEVRCPSFNITHVQDQTRMLGYLRTWSAVQKYRQVRGTDPVLEIENDLVSAFDNKQITARTPVFLRLWKIS